jgi:hypothetical protein
MSTGRKSLSPQKDGSSEPHWGDPSPAPASLQHTAANIEDAAAPLVALLDLLSDEAVHRIPADGFLPFANSSRAFWTRGEPGARADPLDPRDAKVSGGMNGPSLLHSGMNRFNPSLA